MNEIPAVPAASLKEHAPCLLEALALIPDTVKVRFVHMDGSGTCILLESGGMAHIDHGRTETGELCGGKYRETYIDFHGVRISEVN